MLVITELVLPLSWAPYLINDDASGYPAAEIRAIDDCLKRHNVAGCLSVEYPRWFSRYHDAYPESPYACEVAEYVFQTPTPIEKE